MQAVKPGILDTALGRLDPADRALLELSLRQGVKDPDLAELMRMDEEQVRHRRDVALEDLGDDVGIDERERLVATLLDHWRAPGSQATTPVEPAHDAEPSSRRAMIVTIVIVALLGIGTGTLLAVLTQDDDEPGRSAAPAASLPRGAALDPLPAARGARGEARIERRGRQWVVLLAVRGLPRGTYRVWLYDSVRRSIPVARFGSGHSAGQARLPGDPARFRFLDISREASRSRPKHNGASVLRAPIERLVEN